jgi:hypothetical protein
MRKRLDRPQCRVHHGDRDVAVVRGELARRAGRAAPGEHLQLGAEHVALGEGDRLPLRPAILAALDVEDRIQVEAVRRIPGAEVDLVMHECLRAEHPHREDAGGGPARADVSDLAVGELEERHGLVVHFRAHGRELGRHRGHFSDLAPQQVQHVELVDRELGQRAAGRAVLVPAPGLRRQLEGALVGEIGFQEGDAPQFPGVDAFLDDAYARHQPRAVSDGDGDAVLLFQRGDLEPVLQRLGYRLLGVDVLAGTRDHLRHRQVLLVRNRQDHTLQLGGGEQGLHVGCRRHPQLFFEREALVLGTAVAGDDLQPGRLLRRAGQDLGPAAETDDADIDWRAPHWNFLSKATDA